MSLVELVQMVQFFIILIFALFFVYNIVHALKASGTFKLVIKEHSCLRTALLYTRCLYTVNYECFHKYEIWRFYLFG